MNTNIEADKIYLEKTKRWLKEAVFELNLCPFAEKPWNEGKINLTVCQSSLPDNQIQFVFDEIELLQSKLGTNISNSIIIFPTLTKVDDLLDFHFTLEEILMEIEIDQQFQLAPFHPQFCFEGEDPNARVNWVNRSPYAMIHLLRWQEVKDAINSIEGGQTINRINQLTLEKLKPAHLYKIFPWTRLQEK